MPELIYIDMKAKSDKIWDWSGIMALTMVIIMTVGLFTLGLAKDLPEPWFNGIWITISASFLLAFILPDVLLGWADRVRKRERQ